MNKIKYILVGLAILVLCLGLGNYVIDTFGKSGIMNFILSIIILVGVIWIGFTWFDDIDHDESYFKEKLKKLPKVSLTLLTIVVLTVLISSKFLKTLPSLYNKSVVYYKAYEQKTSERPGYFDKMWKTYSQQKENAIINKDIFLQVTSIIMEGRKDGQAVAWKWVSENQPIPYIEFTKFYSNLSSFIEGQREGYYTLEKECQKIAMQHNMLIDTFPNNVYNLVLGRKHIQYKYGFLSDSTNRVFITGKENLK